MNWFSPMWRSLPLQSGPDEGRNPKAPPLDQPAPPVANERSPNIRLASSGPFAIAAWG